MGTKVQGRNGNEATEKTALSVRTLELCDFLIDGMTLQANAENFEDWAARIATARREVQSLLMEAGVKPILHTPEGPVGGLYST